MPSPVFAIGLDAMEPKLLEQFIADGKLPFLARLKEQASYARHSNFAYYATENGWLTFLQGCSPESSHEWGHVNYKAGDYLAKEAPAYSFRKLGPFYAGLDNRKVAVFDLPLVDLVDDVDGAQVLGWGTEANQVLRRSEPAGLVDQLIERHGQHPFYTIGSRTDEGYVTLTYHIPCIYDLDVLRRIRLDLLQAVRQRTAMILDLIEMERWDLLLCAYGEVHTAGHLFWHLGREHPLAEPFAAEIESDFLLDILQEIDRGLARIDAALPADATLMVFSPHGMRGNSLDLCSMFFLPELLYRWSTGKQAFVDSSAADLPALHTQYGRHWSKDVWDLRTPHGEAVLESPESLQANGDPLYWAPSSWYHRQRKSMKAFTLPGYSEGLVRISVAGRDGPGGVSPDDYEAVCTELEEVIMGLIDARSGEPIASQVVRTRSSVRDDGDHLSLADLMVVWKDTVFADVVEHPELGRIGPAPYFRTGGHATEGFVLARGGGFTPGQHREPVSTEDVTATMLDLLGVAKPDHVEGASLAEPRETEVGLNPSTLPQL